MMTEGVQNRTSGETFKYDRISAEEDQQLETD